MTLNNIEAKVYHADLSKDSYFVKVTFEGLGLFINSFSVRPSEYGGYWVQPPKHYQRKGWTATVDFDKSFGLWQIVESKVLEAVANYSGDKNQTAKSSKDFVLTDISDEPINLDDIPF
jgi:hypothetical protein